MKRKFVFNSKQVVGFSPAGKKDSFVSRLLIDKRSVGATSMVANHFTLKPGKKTEAGSHPAPFDEFYYVLRGHGTVYLGDPPQATEIGPDSVVFIPSNTQHFLENTDTEDLELVTVMPGELVEGGNPLYDERIQTWGSSFKMITDDDKIQ